MTPAIRQIKQKKINCKIYRYEHDTSNTSFGLEVVEKLSLNVHEVFKTLIIHLNSGDFAVALIPVCSKASMKKIAKALNVKKASMADTIDAQKITGYIQGGISPIGQKKQLKTVIDESAKKYKTIYVSGGQRGLEIEINPKDLQKLTKALFCDIMLDSCL